MSWADALISAGDGLDRELRAGAEAFLEAENLDKFWHVATTENVFRDEISLHNLWQVEMRRAMRLWWETSGGGEQGYRSAVGRVQYRALALSSVTLFGGAPTANKGWRILVLGLPVFGRIVVGFSSHYQAGQNHNRLGAASRFLGERLLAALEATDLARNARLVTSDDWDGPGLLDGVRRFGPEPLPADAPDPHLRDARNTTLKKVLASCMTIEIIQVGSLTDKLSEYLEAGTRLQS